MNEIQRPEFDKSWTLFLDRDGVINVEQPGSYITNWEEFVFYEGAEQAVKELGEVFGTLVIVTNQRGVGRGLMTPSDLRDISNNMCAAIQLVGGRISKVYACTSVQDDDHNRKPNSGMALQAKEDHPHVDFHKSVVVGNNLSDMEFGKRLGMYSVFLATTQKPLALPHDLVNEQYTSLSEWAKSLLSASVEG